MANKVFVGGLSWDTSDATLAEAFRPFGDVLEARVVLDRDTGRSRGFGFVTFAENDGAQRAIEEMDGRELDGRMVRVNEAHERDRGGGGDGRRGGPGGRRGGGGGRGPSRPRF